MESLLSSTFKLGGDASIAVGPVGAGIEGPTAMNLSADLLSFSSTKGLFGGISLEGAGDPMASTSAEAKQKDLVEKSRMTLDSCLANSNMGRFHDHIKDAKGIFIVPQLLKAAFFFAP